MQETRVWFLGWEYPLEKKMATHSSIFAWEIPWTEEPGRLQSMGLQTVRHNLVTKQQINTTRSNFISGSVQFSRSVVSDSLRPREPQHSRWWTHHQHPEFTQTHVHRVSDAIQPSHPLSSPSPPAPNPSQHQSLFQWVNALHEVAKVLEFQL